MNSYHSLLRRPPVLAWANRGHGWIKRRSLCLGLFMSQRQDGDREHDETLDSWIRSQKEEPQIRREPHYYRRHVLMISLVISVCCLLLTDTLGTIFFLNCLLHQSSRGRALLVKVPALGPTVAPKHQPLGWIINCVPYWALVPNSSTFV